MSDLQRNFLHNSLRLNGAEPLFQGIVELVLHRSDIPKTGTDLSVAFLPDGVVRVGARPANSPAKRADSPKTGNIPRTTRQRIGTGGARALYIIQLSGPVQTAWREAITAQGVELVQYVPEDAFIARISNGELGSLKKLAFVQWIGKFRANHKVHQAIAGRAALKRAGDLVNVSILMAPDSAAPEIVQARRSLRVLRQQSNLRLGTVLRGSVSATDLDALAASENVLWIEPEFQAEARR